MDYPPLKSLIDISELNRSIAEGYVSVRQHPEDNRLKILNYTAKCQYGGMWNPITKACRGLIIHLRDEDVIGNNAVVVSRLFLLRNPPPSNISAVSPPIVGFPQSSAIRDPDQK